METYKPQTPEQALEVVAGALSGEIPLEIQGAGSKRDWGRPSSSSAILDMSGISGISLYEPEELVISAAAGTPMVEIEAALAGHLQLLGFEPADYGQVLGDEAGRATLGGVLACNLSGPRRIQLGAARDHFLGFEAISGRAEKFKGGGRVVKNVTGFDLAKLLAGSFGTLAALTSVTLKAVPAPEEARTITVLGPEGDEGNKLLTRALGSPYDPSGAAHLPAAVAPGGEALTVLRIEGPVPSVQSRCKDLEELFKTDGRIGQLDRDETQSFWRGLRDVESFADQLDTQLWRLSVPPAEGARVAENILRELDGKYFLDWGGGLVWLQTEACEDAAQGQIRRAIEGCGGHGTLIRASAETRARIPVFQPQPAPLHDLSRRVKENFDPRAILNPGRMFEDI